MNEESNILTNEKLQHKLSERVKELNCLYSISKLTEDSALPLESLLQQISELLPPAMTYPEKTCCRILYNNHNYYSSNFQVSKWVIKSEIRVNNQNRGSVEVFFIEENSNTINKPFIIEEKNLINAVGQRLSSVLELKNSKENLELTRLRLEEAHNINKMGDFIYEIQNKTIHVSDILYSIFELPVGVVRDISFFRKIYKEDRFPLKKSFELALFETGIFNEEYRIKINGKTLYLHTVAKIFSDDKSKHIQMIGTTRDITKNVMANNELKKAREDAETSSRAKSSFLTNMSHELRTPLNSITGYCQLLEIQEINPLSKKQIQYVKIISDNGKHLLGMVNDILDLSLVEADKFSLTKKPFNIYKLLIKMPTLLGTIIYKKKMEFSINIDSNISWFNGDEIRIKQVVYNLLSNAIKFTSAGQKIGLECKKKEDNVLIIVWDEGPGISENKLESIFTPFENTGSPFQTLETGAGLGLSISKKIIEQHGGSIKVKSRENVGSRFTISLPAGISNNHFLYEDILIEKHQIEKYDFKNLQILLFEDNPNSQELVKEALKPCRCSVDCVESGYKGILQLQKCKYDLILMDIILPDGNGTDFMKTIKKQLKSNIPFIAFTASAMSGDKEHYLKEGFEAYLSKPFDFSDLREAINSLIF